MIIFSELLNNCNRIINHLVSLVKRSKAPDLISAGYSQTGTWVQIPHLAIITNNLCHYFSSA